MVVTRNCGDWRGFFVEEENFHKRVSPGCVRLFMWFGSDYCVTLAALEREILN